MPLIAVTASTASTAFTTCMEAITRAIHTTILLKINATMSEMPYWIKSTYTINTRIVKRALPIINTHVTSPMSLMDEENVKTAIRDAERRILFGITRRPRDTVWQQNFIRIHLELAFTVNKLTSLFEERSPVADGP